MTASRIQAVAIDGPSASGKSTVARRVAAGLPGFIYVDSGALYRLVTYEALERGVAAEDSLPLRTFLDALNPEFRVRDGAVVYGVGGREAGAELRTQRVTDHVSYYAAIPLVRERVVAWLRGLTRFGSVVMEGRDIGTVVFPDAAAKFYLDASAEERARRRQREVSTSVPGATVAAVGQSLAARDRIDSGRAVAPLRTASDAVIIDSTGMTIDAVVARILECVRGS